MEGGENISAVLEKAGRGERLLSGEGLLLFEEAPLAALGSAADRRRKTLHPDSTVTYVVDRNINYSNVCISGCRFCAFFRKEDSPEAYIISRDELREKISELFSAGGRSILLQGGMHPSLPLNWYVELLQFMKSEFPELYVHGFSPPEIIHFSKIADKPITKVIPILRDAGLDSIPGGGAEILSDEIRSKVSPGKCTADEWIEVMRAAHGLGMRSTATMMFGHVEEPRNIIEHLDRVRALQEETGGFTAFIPWTFQAENTALASEVGFPAGGHAYLRVLALSRLYLDNVKNIQASWVTQGGKIAQVALFFGANDLGSTMLEENVVKAAGVSFRMSESGLRRLAETAGFIPKRRNFQYEIL
ncbi:MAG: dehypoxanthine futalosine cyclase [Planctomycetota bacterium]|nr:MAG: dehypoxanthine futalosine cyclase [Planctomycetota bacterium]